MQKHWRGGGQRRDCDPCLHREECSVPGVSGMLEVELRLRRAEPRTVCKGLRFSPLGDKDTPKDASWRNDVIGHFQHTLPPTHLPNPTLLFTYLPLTQPSSSSLNVTSSKSLPLPVPGRQAWLLSPASCPECPALKTYGTA